MQLITLYSKLFPSNFLFFIICDSIILFYFIIFLIYFFNFIFGCVGSSLLCVRPLWLWRAGATLLCGAQASYCGGFSCCGAWDLGARASVVVAHGLQSAGSVVVAHGLDCSAACGIFPDQGSNPCPLRWAGGFLTTAPPGKSQATLF